MGHKRSLPLHPCGLKLWHGSCYRTRALSLILAIVLGLVLWVSQASTEPAINEAAMAARAYLPYAIQRFSREYIFRIGVRVVNGVGEFYDRATSLRFVPRGNNYVRLAPMAGAPGNLWHCVLNPGFYDPARAEAALRKMHADGYNVVRIFVDCCRTGSNVGDAAGGLSSAYLDNVADLLQRAKANGIFVLLDLDLTPADGGYDEMWQACCSVFDGENLRYLTPGGVAAKRRYDQDFVRALISRKAPLDAIFAFGLTNEVCFSADRVPLTLTSGLVTTANGRTYDMAKPADKKRMVDENLVYWIDQQRAAIRELDPTALVDASFFQPQEPNPTRIRDPRLSSTWPAIWQSQADFIDLHAYPGGELTLAQYVENYGMQGMQTKPIIMGEFGAFRAAYSSVSGAAQALQDWEVASCAYGFDGWLLWTWDCDEDATLWNALSENDAINNALAPKTRPDPCQPGGFAGQNVARGKPASASRFGALHTPGMAVDGPFSTWWGAEASPPQWIEIDLQASYSVAGVRLVTSQSPTGATVHRVWGRGATGPERLLHEFSGTTQDGQTLEYSPPALWTGIRYVRVETVSSPSWVSWREIEVIAGGP
jgi:hypothetical protein